MRSVDDLRGALDYPTGDANPDIAGIIARGRRRRTGRRAAGLAAVAAIVAVAAGVPHLIPGSDRALPPAPPAGPRPAGTVEAPTQFDPTARTLRVGWLPPQLKSAASFRIEPRMQDYTSHDSSYVNGGPDLGLVVRVLSKGVPAAELPSGALGLPYSPVQRPTRPIHGRPAFCLTEPSGPGSCHALRWQYSPGAWAQVSYAGSAGKTEKEAAGVARRVAESVSLGPPQPVRLPFRLTGPLAKMRIYGTSIDVLNPGQTGAIDGEVWSASVTLAEPGATPTAAGPSLRIGALERAGDPSGRSRHDKDKYEQNTTVAGKPASLTDDSKGLIVWGVHGIRINVYYEGMDGDALSAYGAVNVVARPGDLATWVPLRTR